MNSPDDTSALVELAERCEAATGPDRELDAAIHVALFVPADAARVDVGDGYVGYYPVSGPYKSARQVLGYSRSLDAAMTLVPEGWLVQLSDWEAEVLRERGPWQSILIPRGKRDDFKHALDARCDHAATPALALTAAALRARAAKDKS